MKQLTCEMCGSTDLLKQDGFFVCQTCGTKYSVEEAKKMMIEGIVEVQGTVKVDKTPELSNLIKRVFSFLTSYEFTKAKEYCQKIFDIDARNKFADYATSLADEMASALEWGKDLVLGDIFDFRIMWDCWTYQQIRKMDDAAIRESIKLLEDKYYIEEDATHGFLLSKSKVLLKVYNSRLCDDSVQLPKGITAISYRCNLRPKNLIIPDSVTSIGYEAFFFQSNIKSLTLGKGVKIIEESAFIGCQDLTSIFIPDSVIAIEKKAFYYCTKLSSLTIGKGLQTIGDEAFSGCDKLNNVVIPDSVKSIGKEAFFYCDNLVRVEIPSHLQYQNDTFPASCKIVVRGQEASVSRVETSVKDNTIYKGESAEKSTKNAGNFGGGCYVATCVYGSYDCPEVWTLRRYRDDTLGATWYGRAFIKFYYAISPTLVKWFGKTKWFKKMWKGTLDRMVKKLQDEGVESTPYDDKEW